MPLAFPPLYVILGASSGRSVPELAAELASAGVELMQYRDKQATPRALLDVATALVQRLKSFPARIIVNDRPDIATIASAAGVHVGQEDLPVSAARAIVGHDRWVGVSTHTLDQVRQADSTSADYIAFGPIFPTTTKIPADPVVGIDELRRARALTRKPLVAIGGITLDLAEKVWREGADSLAVSGDIISADDPADRARAFLRRAPSVFGI